MSDVFDESRREMADLLDGRAIVAVAVRYCWALDENDWTTLRTVFLPDATARLGNDDALAGVDAIVERCSAALGPLDDSQHIVSDHQVTVTRNGSGSPDTATHRCYLQAQHIRREVENGPNYIVAGRYVDDLVRTADGWRIAHRDLVVMWTEGNPAVVRAR